MEIEIYTIAKDIKEKAINVGQQIKSEIDKVSKKDQEKTHVYTGDETIYSYKVEFDKKDNSQDAETNEKNE